MSGAEETPFFVPFLLTLLGFAISQYTIYRQSKAMRRIRMSALASILALEELLTREKERTKDLNK